MKLQAYTLQCLAEMICGAHGTGQGYSWVGFPYRSGPKIIKFFRSADSPIDGIHGTRDAVVYEHLEYLNSLKPEQPTSPSTEITRVVIELMRPQYFEAPEADRNVALTALNKILRDDALEVRLDPQTGRPKLYRLANSGTVGPAQQAAVTSDTVEFGRVCDALLVRFDELYASAGSPQERGYGLEKFFTELMTANRVEVHSPFRRSAGAEQIDGAIGLNNCVYLVESKWTKSKLGVSVVDGLHGKIGRSGKGTYGIVVAINGLAEGALNLMKASPNKCIFVVDGFDIRRALEEHLEFGALLTAKRKWLDLMGDPVLTVADYLVQQGKSKASLLP